MKRPSQPMAIHSAAPVCHRQKPMLIAPPNSSTMFQGTASRSLMVRMLNRKNSMAAVRMTALLWIGSRAGTKLRRVSTATIAPATMIRVAISLRVTGPRSVVQGRGLCPQARHALRVRDGRPGVT